MEIHTKKYDFTPHGGQLLVSEPFLSDPNFRKTVVLLCEHEEHGSVGFILNRLLNMDTNEVIPGLLNVNFPVFYGGPVEQNTLHFIHRVGELLEDSFPIGEGVFWGGNIEVINDLLQQGKADPSDFKFFYWIQWVGEGQLTGEIEQKAWWLTPLKPEIIFSDDLEEIWPMSVRAMGADFAYLADSPEDYNWN